MKIAQAVCTFPPDIGGMGQVAFEEAKRLALDGHDVTVYTLDHGGIYSDEELPFRVVRLKTYLKAGNGGFVPQILSQLRGYDVFHFHYPWYGAEIVSFTKIPMVVTYHMDARPDGIMKRSAQKISDILSGSGIFKKAKKVLAVDRDHFTSTTFAKNIDNKKVLELPNAVDSEIFKPGEVNIEELGLADWKGKQILLFVGNLMHGKRLDLLFEAVALLNNPEVRVLVVGGGYAETAYKEQISRLHLEKVVHFTGKIAKHEKLVKFYALADAVVVPSDEESFSLVVLEAMATEKPVIVSNLPGLRRRIAEGQFGILFQKGSAESLSGAIRHLFALPQEVRQTMGQNGRIRIEKEYTWDIHVKKLLEIYASVI